MRNTTMRIRTMIVLTLMLTVMSCAEPPPPPPPDTSVENVDLGIRLAAVPEGLETTVNEGSSLELQPTAEGVEGLVWFVVSPDLHAVNLVAAVANHQAQIEGLPDGEYMGGQELQGDFGVAFYSRGRYSEAEATVEETALFLIHPTASRQLEIHYRYPAADDSAARVEQLIAVLAELE
jgi:hypothetical protein